MKGAVLHGPRDVRLEDMGIPSVSDGEVLAKVKLALTCGTDAKVYIRGSHPKMLKTPTLFGHEWTGVVERVGRNVKKFKKGDRVTSANSSPCFNCYYCRIKKFSLCENLTFLNGAYAEYIKIPKQIVETNLFKIPADITYEEAAFLEPLSCVVHGVGEIGLKKREEVAVIGAGPIGLLFLLVLKNLGVKVTMADKNKQRLEIAEKLGCDEVVLVEEKKDIVEDIKKLSDKGKGMDVVIEATGLPRVWEQSIKMVKGGGKVLLFGGCKPGDKVCFDTKPIHYSQLTLRGVFHHTPYYVKKAYDLIAAKKLNLAPLITEKMPLNEIPTALEKIINGEGIKIAIIP